MKKAGHQCRFQCGRDACNGVILSTPAALLMHDQYPADGTKGFLVRFALSFYEDPLNYGFGTKLFV